MTYDEMNDRLKENLKEQKQLMSELEKHLNDERIPEHFDKKMVGLMDEFGELWDKVKVY